MKKRIFVSVMALLLLFAMAATASAVSVTRDLPDVPVTAGAEFEVSISQTGFFVVGTVTEVLPVGYAYVGGSATGVDDAVYTPGTRTLVLTIDSGVSTVTYNVTAGTADGTFVGTYATVDGNADPVLGDVGGQDTVTIVVNGPPQPRITSPANGDAVSGTVPVTAVDDSGEGDIAYALFEYYNDTNCNCAADDGNAWVEIENDTSSAGGWNTTWNTTLIPDCCHLIRVTMVDGTDQNGTDEINVVVSNHAPVPNITAPCGGDVLNRSVVISVTDESSEFGAGIAYTRFEYYYDENCNCAADDGNTWVEIGNDTDGTDGWSAEWDTLTDGVAAVPNGCYMLRATMVDMHGRTGSDEINVELSNPDFCIDLKAGKNLVSIPKAIIGPKHANDVFNLDPYAGEVCWYYRADLERYVANPIVKPCRGYWVFKNAPEMICVYFDDAAAAPTQSLREGWNMIGHIRTTAMPVYVEGSDADFGSITGLEEPEGTKLYRQIATYHDGTWTDYPAGSLEEMTPGWGYWISMKQNATMSGSWV
ncbi:hypothetical protein CW696_09165 [ANME-2 cluster archaeon]|nr:MAG: hypothetical protein CW696_09165 [ANME-2 cluster archaeon]